MGPPGDLEPDVILMDLYMPGCTGPELAAVLRQQERWVSTPIVFLSTEEGLEEQIAAINAGGDEFLTKPIAPAHLAAALAARARRAGSWVAHLLRRIDRAPEPRQPEGPARKRARPCRPRRGRWPTP